MEYNADTFVTHSQPSVATRYDTCLKGAFYYVYTNNQGDYHMAKEDEASLLARIRFYQDFISKNNYPVYSQRVGLTDGSLSNNEVLSQVLGLPFEMTYVKKGERIVPLTAQEILSRISFEDNLFPGYSYIDELNEQILFTDHDSVTGCINYLIEHGIFLQNPERVLNDPDGNENYYPFYIEEHLLPKGLIQEKETADKLIMDFVDDPFSITKDVYLNVYKPLDKMSLAEKATLAFSTSRAAKPNPSRETMIKALKHYFFALAKDLMNDFYRKYYHIRGLFGFTVLDHDFEGLGVTPRFVYQGTHQNMYALSYRSFTLDEKSGQVKQSAQPRDYVFDSDRKSSIGLAFKCVQKYFLRKKEYAFIPSVFLRMMGLPYPSLEKVKYFDFEHGDSASFLALLPFKKNVAYAHYGLMLSLLKNDGTQYSYRNWQSDVPFFLRHRENKGIFFSDLYLFPDEPDQNFLFLQEKKDTIFDPIFQGQGSVFHEAVHDLESYALGIGSASSTTNYTSFLVKYEKDGIVEPIKKLFELLNQGYCADEAYNLLMSEDKELDPNALADLLLVGVGYQAKKPAKRATDALFNVNPKNVLDLVNHGEIFYDPYLPYPYVHKGRRFIGYSKTMDSPVIFDSSDKELLKINLEMSEEMYALNDESVSFCLPIFGRDIFFDAQVSIDDCIKDMPGLPLEADAFDLPFEDNISIFSRPDHKELVQNDESLRMIKVFGEALKRGVYLISKSGASTIHINPGTLSDNYAYFLNPDFLRYYLSTYSLSHHENLTKAKSNEPYRKLIETPTFFDRFFYKALFGHLDEGYRGEEFRQTYHFDEIASAYATLFNHAVYQSIAQEDNDLPHHFIGYYYDKKKNLYVAPGTIFTAYSETNNPADFGFAESDYPLLLQALEACKEEYKDVSNPLLKANLITAGLGLPDICVSRMVDEFMEEETEGFEARIHDALRFGKCNEQEENNVSLTDFFALKKGSFSYLYSSTRVYHKALTLGFYMSPDSGLMENDLLYPDQLIKNLDKTIDDLDNSVARVFVPKEEFKETLLPGSVAYSLAVDHFIDYYSSQTNLLPPVLFTLREALNYVYSLDPAFLANGINTLQGSEGTKAYYDYCYSLLKDFSLPGVKVPTSAIASLMALFVLYQEQGSIRKMTKRMMKKDR